MARQKKSSAFEDVIGLVALLPWWVGVVLALMSYLWLHYVASQPVAPPADIKHMGDSLVSQLWHAVAAFLQYIIPLACVVGAAVSAYRRHERSQLHRNMSVSPSRTSLESMSWQQFEKLVGEVFRRKGFTVEERGGNAPDGGVDLALRLGRDRYLVQCKQWKSERVGVATVRELFGVMTAEHAVGGFVVTSGQFTDDAKKFAEGRSIELVGTDTLLALVRETSSGTPSSVQGPRTESVPACPSCGAVMVKRVAKQGPKAGDLFWGCSRYPGCRGVRAG